MNDGLYGVATVVTAVSTAVVAGVFFAFSTFVMKGLGDTPPATGVAAMQAINVAAPTPPFMLLLFGSALSAVVLAVASLFRLDEPGAVVRLVASLVSLLAIALTGGYHVPRNNALAALDPNTPAAAEYWARYLREWTAWNHVRTLAPLAAAVTLTISLAAE